jgi:hypothetical protein
VLGRPGADGGQPIPLAALAERGHSGIAAPALAQALYDRKRGDNEILWLEAGLHTDLYDNQPYVSQAAAAAAAFFHRRLSTSLD